MELGVDIASLNAVGLRNVPTDPGQLRPAVRPGRPVRPARPRRHLLRHRQRPRLLLLPALTRRWSPVPSPPPRLDLANEDLVRSHVHAIWLAETDQSMRSRITDLVDADGDTPVAAHVAPEVWRALTDPDAAPRATGAPST